MAWRINSHSEMPRKGRGQIRMVSAFCSDCNGADHAPLRGFGMQHITDADLQRTNEWRANQLSQQVAKLEQDAGLTAVVDPAAQAGGAAGSSAKCASQRCGGFGGGSAAPCRLIQPA